MGLVNEANISRFHTVFLSESKVLPKSRKQNLPAVLPGEHCSAGWCCNSGPSGRIAVEHYVSLGSANFVLMFDRELEHVSFTSIQSNWQLDRVRASRLTTRPCARIRRKMTSSMRVSMRLPIRAWLLTIPEVHGLHVCRNDSPFFSSGLEANAH